MKTARLAGRNKWASWTEEINNNWRKNWWNCWGLMKWRSDSAAGGEAEQPTLFLLSSAKTKSCLWWRRERSCCGALEPFQPINSLNFIPKRWMEWNGELLSSIQVLIKINIITVLALLTIFFQLVAERIEGINLKNEGNEALVAGRAIHELNGLKRNEMSECGSLPPTIGEMEWKQWTQRENFSFWVEFMRQWNGAPLAGGCLGLFIVVGYEPEAPLRSRQSNSTLLELSCLPALPFLQLPRRRQAALLCLFCFIEERD